MENTGLQNHRQELSTTWIENLAIEEINMNESGIVDLHEHLNPIHFLEESSIEFMKLEIRLNSLFLNLINIVVSTLMVILRFSK